LTSTRSYAAAGALTPRMRDVLVSAAAGRMVKQTARELGLSEATIKSIRSAAIARLGARNVVEAVAIMVRGDL
jgi:DNA-binding NarL/FixJ family response regulator